MPHKVCHANGKQKKEIFSQGVKWFIDSLIQAEKQKTPICWGLLIISLTHNEVFNNKMHLLRQEQYGANGFNSMWTQND